MTDPYSTTPASRGRRGAAAVAVAALAGTMLAPGLATGPAAAAAACDEALPYRAVADAELLRLHALDLPQLGLGPLVDARISATGAGMTADAAGSNSDPAAVAAARDIATNLLGIDLLDVVSIGDLGQEVAQQAPPTNSAPATGTGVELDLGVLRADIGDLSAHATWNEEFACGASTGPAAASAASLLDAEVLPSGNGQALVALPQNLASTSETGLVSHDNAAASYATATASLADVRLFAGSESEIAVKVISEPTLAVTATGDADTSSVEYDSPLLEISAPGVGDLRLDATGSHIDLLLPGSGVDPAALGTDSLPVLGGTDPLGQVLGGLDGSALSGLSAGTDQIDPVLKPTAAPAQQSLPALGAGDLPVLGDVLSGTPSVAGLGDVAVLRLSLGALEEEISDDVVSAGAASLRLQVLTWEGGDGPTEPASAVLDLGLGLLSAAATAPEPTYGDEPEPTPPPGEGGECEGEDCPEEELPVTGSTVGLVAGAGVLLAVAGRLMMLLARGTRSGGQLIG